VGREDGVGGVGMIKSKRREKKKGRDSVNGCGRYIRLFRASHS
jgi:hypothetical protein